MEAVCELGRPTWYRNTTGPEGSPGRKVWVCVWLWERSCKYGLLFSQAWMSEFLVLHAWVLLQPRSNPPFATPGLPLSFPPSIPLSPNGRFGCLSGNCAVGGWKAALACEWVDMWPQRAYELMNMCLCSSLETLYSPPHFTVFSGCKSLSATSLKLLPLNQLCLCDAKRAADRRIERVTQSV